MSEFEQHRKNHRKRSRKYLLTGNFAFYAGVFSSIAIAILVSGLLSVYFPSAKETAKKEPQAVEVSSNSVSAKKPASITYTAAGDVILHKPFLESPVYLNAENGTYDYTSIFTYCQNLLTDSDYTSVTFEGAFVDGSTG